MANVASSGVPEGITTSDGVPLKVSLARATRRQRIQALVLVLPLLLFLLVAFVLPIGEMLFRSFYSPVGSSVMPSFTKVIKDWDGEGLPPEALGLHLGTGNLAPLTAGTLAADPRPSRWPPKERATPLDMGRKGEGCG